MARKYPKFLWSNPSNAKSSGPFIVHTQHPRFIVQPKFDEKRNLIHTSVVEIWEEEQSFVDVWEIQKEIPTWFNESGRYQSIHEHDKLLCGLSQLEFLKDRREHFTIDEARKVIQILFPFKAKKIHHGSSSYGLKHRLEHISNYMSKGHGYKYCSNDTLIKAFALEGFNSAIEDGSPNPCFNIYKKDVVTAYHLFR
ncbi:hypothetical protein ACVW0P_003858 [Mucilaginibacter sp. UYNi724]